MRIADNVASQVRAFIRCTWRPGVVRAPEACRADVAPHWRLYGLPPLVVSRSCSVIDQRLPRLALARKAVFTSYAFRNVTTSLRYAGMACRRLAVGGTVNHGSLSALQFINTLLLPAAESQRFSSLRARGKLERAAHELSSMTLIWTEVRRVMYCTRYHWRYNRTLWVFSIASEMPLPLNEKLK